MNWPKYALFGLAATLPGVADAQVVRGPVGGFTPPPAVMVPLQPIQMQVSVQIVTPTLSPVLTTPSSTPTSALQTSDWSVNVQVIPPPEPAEGGKDGDCHDGDETDNVDVCEGAAESTPPDEATVGAQAVNQVEVEQATLQPAAEPKRGHFSGWYVAIALALGALLFGWIRNIRRR